MRTPLGLTLDCTHPGEQARFWATALGYVEPPPPDGFASWEDWLRQHGVSEEEFDDGAYLADPGGVGPSLSLLKVPEPKTAKNRLHLDLRVGGGRDTTPQEERWRRVQAEVARLTAAGATVLATVDEGDVHDHVVMQDPEGNEFCVV